MSQSSRSLSTDATAESAQHGDALLPGEIRIRNLGKKFGMKPLPFEDVFDLDEDEGGEQEPDEDAEEDVVEGEAGERWALRNVNLHIRPGQHVAIVGANGSGKSTLIRILARTLPPSEGVVEGAGLVIPFRALKSPVNPRASGCDNLRTMARLLQIPLDRLEERLPDIIAFSGLGQMAYERVNRYSQRSFSRLSMAMGLFMDADIYLIDDGIGVGDEVYRLKFQDRFLEVIGDNVTLVYASNGLGQLRACCGRGVWLHRGHLVADGEVNSVIQRFTSKSDELVELDDLAQAPSSDEVHAPVADDLRRTSYTIPEEWLEPMEDWAREAARAESSWNKVIERWRSKLRPTDLSNTGTMDITGRCTLAAIHALWCLNSQAHPVRRILPGESLYVQLHVETFEPDVTIFVRLELDEVPTLVLVAEPLVPFRAAEPGQFLFRAKIDSNLLAQSFDSVMHKLRTRVLFEDKSSEKREMINATVRYDLRGDVRFAFDERRHLLGHPMTSILQPAPSFVQPPKGFEDADEFSRAHKPMNRLQILNRRPAIRPRLDWMVYRVRPAEAHVAPPPGQLETTTS